MSFDFAGILGPVRRPDSAPPVEHVMIRRPLQRLMAFTGRSIDDIVNCPIAKREVIGYYKLGRWVERQSEISELERQWNGVA